MLAGRQSDLLSLPFLQGTAMPIQFIIYKMGPAACYLKCGDVLRGAWLLNKLDLEPYIQLQLTPLLAHLFRSLLSGHSLL